MTPWVGTVSLKGTMWRMGSVRVGRVFNTTHHSSTEEYYPHCVSGYLQKRMFGPLDLELQVVVCP